MRYRVTVDPGALAKLLSAPWASHAVLEQVEARLEKLAEDPHAQGEESSFPHPPGYWVVRFWLTGTPGRTQVLVFFTIDLTRESVYVHRIGFIEYRS